MKKVLSLLLALGMVLTLAACSASGAPAGTEAAPTAGADPAAQGKVYKVGICQLVDRKSVV